MSIADKDLDQLPDVDRNQNPLISGYMIKRGHVFSSWHRRYFELRADHLSYYSDEDKLLAPHIFRLYPDMLVKDCALRPFCFCLFRPGNNRRNDILYVATYSMADKDIWMETVMAVIYLLQAGNNDRKSHDVVLQHGKNAIIRKSISGIPFLHY